MNYKLLIYFYLLSIFTINFASHTYYLTRQLVNHSGHSNGLSSFQNWQYDEVRDEEVLELAKKIARKKIYESIESVNKPWPEIQKILTSILCFPLFHGLHKVDVYGIEFTKYVDNNSQIHWFQSPDGLVSVRDNIRETTIQNFSDMLKTSIR
ncbi:hypothetical protein HYV10_02185 [Candidatus Dependentiae bacterium]|nr:hypothetical protein [Candidatus Dependentiae bacterium]